jgi:hypothetical protein
MVKTFLTGEMRRKNLMKLHRSGGLVGLLARRTYAVK